MIRKRYLILFFILTAGFSLCIPGRISAADFDDNTPGVFKGLHFGDAAWADFDGDGEWDLAVSGDNEDGNKVYFYRNNGAGDFEKTQEITVNSNVAATLAWGDYNNSGSVDLLVTTRDPSMVGVTEIYENDGEGNFSKADVSGLDITREARAGWADFNNDGLMDLAIIGNDVVRVYENNGGGSFTPRDLLDNDESIYFGSIAWGDYNNSGYVDLLVMGDLKGHKKNRATYLFENNGSSFTKTVKTSTVTPVLNGDVAWGDLNNNGLLDFIVIGSTKGVEASEANIFEVYENKGRGENYALEKSTEFPGLNDASLGLADVTADNLLDIVVMGRNEANEAKTLIYENKGSFQFSKAEAGLDGMYDGALALADYTGQGCPDLYVHGITDPDDPDNSDNWQVKLYKNNETKDPPKAVEGGEMASVYYDGKLYIMWNPPDAGGDQEGYYYNFRVGEEEDGDNLVPARYGTPLMGNYLTKATTSTFKDEKIQNGQIPGIKNYKYIRVLEVSGSNYHWGIQSIDPSLGFTWKDASTGTWSANQVFIDTTPPAGFPDKKPSVISEYTYDRDLVFTLDKGTSTDPETGIYGAYIQLQEIDHGNIFPDEGNLVKKEELWDQGSSSVWGSGGLLEYKHRGSYDKSYRIRVKARHGYTITVPTEVYKSDPFTNATPDSEILWNPESVHYTSTGPCKGWSQWSESITPVELLTIENNFIREPGVHSADIGYFALEDGRARIRVFDTMGNQVKTLLDEHVDSGQRKFVEWKGLNKDEKKVASGIYYINVQVPSGEDTSKVAVVK